jgi:hypothetical protein
LRLVLERWLTDPAIVAASWDALFGGWVASFAGDSDAALAMRLAFGALGALGLAGAALGARKNRLDAWYVLATLAMIFIWVFPEPIARRLLYPVVPLMLVFAAEALMAAARMKRGIDARRVLLPAFALLAVLVLPATVLVAQKALDTRPLFQGSAYSLASITDYYTTVNVPRARAIAGEHAAVLAGIESLQRATPAGARVMWMRPEYVAVVGRRAAVPWFLSWDRGTLAAAIHESGANFLVVSRLYKNDLAGVTGEAFKPIVDAPPAYLHPTLIIANPANRDMEFVLLEVDREALDRIFSPKAPPRG